MSRGLTLVEMLLAIALLSGLSVAATMWTQATLRGTTNAETRRWEVAARRVLQLISDDLLTHDVLPVAPSADRVRVEEDVLTITTRSSPQGALTHVYAFDQVAATLARHETAANHSTSGDRNLLSRVTEWLVSFDDEQRRLSVTLVSSTASVKGSLRVP